MTYLSVRFRVSDFQFSNSFIVIYDVECEVIYQTVDV